MLGLGGHHRFIALLWYYAVPWRFLCEVWEVTIDSLLSYGTMLCLGGFYVGLQSYIILAIP